MAAPDAPHMVERPTADLLKPIYRAIGMSMTLTGLVTRDGRDWWTHDDYDEAMAAVAELFRRAGR